MKNRTRYILFRALFFTLQMPIGVLFPFFALYLRSDVGLSPERIGCIHAVSGVTVILFQQWWGFAADVLVSKRRLIVVNSCAAGLIFLVAGQLHQWWLILVVMFVFFTLFSPILQLLNGFLFMHEGSEARFGVIRSYASLGFILANVGTGFIADRLTGGRFWFIFPFFSVLCVLSSVLILPLREPRVAASKMPRLRFMEVQRFFLRRPTIIVFLVVTLLYQSAHSFSYMAQSFLMADMGADNRLVALSYSLAALLEIPVFFVVGRLIRYAGELSLIVFAGIVQALRWALVWGATSPNQIVLISLSHAVTFALFYACAVTYMNRQAGPHLKASAQTLLALVHYGFASVLGYYVGGQVTGDGIMAATARWLAVAVIGLPDRGGLRNLYVFCSLLAGLSAFVCAGLALWERQRGRNSSTARPSGNEMRA